MTREELTNIARNCAMNHADIETFIVEDWVLRSMEEVENVTAQKAVAGMNALAMQGVALVDENARLFAMLKKNSRTWWWLSIIAASAWAVTMAHDIFGWL